MNKFYSSQNGLRESRQQCDENSDLCIKVPTDSARTLLLMGPTRAGKSTICQVLRDSRYEPERPTFYSATRTPESQQIGGLRIIDMPGFNDLQTQTRNSLSNNLILKMLREELDDKGPVHLFAFIFSLYGGIKKEDINAMLFVQSELPDLAGRTILVVTHAEELDDQGKNRLVKEFFSHPDVKKNNLQNFFQEDIFFVGCLRYESLNQRDETAIAYQHQNILGMRKKFIEKCFDDIHPFVQQRTTNYLSMRSVSVAIVVLVMMFGIVGPPDGFSIINKKINGLISANNSTTEKNITPKETIVDEKDIIPSNIPIEQVNNQESLSSHNIEKSSDSTNEKLVWSSATDVLQSESNTITKEIVVNMVKQMDSNVLMLTKTLNQILEKQSNDMAEIKRRLSYMEDTSKRNQKNKNKA
jgi:GTPase SAR1 family protein